MATGKLVVISAPSGAGKTTIAGEMLQRFSSLSFSVSATTRSKREGEQDGRDYFFLTRDEFTRRIVLGDFVEWEEIYGNYYGTLKEEIERARKEQKHLLFDVDVKGGLSIKRHFPEALLIFIRPPSIEALAARLRGRKTEDDAVIVRRMERVAMEMTMAASFDRICVNDDLAVAVAEVEQIVREYLSA